jgi:hypothetical protein
MAQEDDDRECDGDESGTQGQTENLASQSDVVSIAPSEDFVPACEAGSRRLRIVGRAGEEAARKR